MAKATRKTLPKDFEEMLVTGDMDALKAVFDKCLPDAKGGVFKQSAIAFSQCPDALTRWLVEEKGADIESGDSYGSSPLCSRTGALQRYPGCHFEVLLDLGADINAGENGRGTPLHRAARPCNIDNATILIRRGAKIDALDNNRHTPLKTALVHSNNAVVENLLPLAQLLIDAGARVTPDMADDVKRIGERFEFIRAAYNPAFLPAADAALTGLYELFGGAPVARRQMHDGISPIAPPAGDPAEQFETLWEMLVPAMGAAQTVQGEVIRLAGKIADEIDRNGGVNWDRAYRNMANHLVLHLQSGTAVSDAALTAAQTIIADLPDHSDDAGSLGLYALEWVLKNPLPVPLPKPPYDR